MKRFTDALAMTLLVSVLAAPFVLMGGAGVLWLWIDSVGSGQEFMPYAKFAAELGAYWLIALLVVAGFCLAA